MNSTSAPYDPNFLEWHVCHPSHTFVFTLLRSVIFLFYLFIEGASVYALLFIFDAFVALTCLSFTYFQVCSVLYLRTRVEQRMQVLEELSLVFDLDERIVVLEEGEKQQQQQENEKEKGKSHHIDSQTRPGNTPAQ